MAEPFFIELTQGETFIFQARFVGEDLGAAVLSVQSTLPTGGFTLTKPESDEVKAISATDVWPIGTHPLEIWFSYPSGDIREEKAIDLRVKVRAPV